MTKSKNSFLLILTVLAIALISVGSVFLLSNNKVKAEQGVIDGETQAKIESQYIVGDSINVPFGKIEYNGNVYSATETYICFPNGNAVSVSGSYVFEKAGVYTLVYSAEVEGKFVEAKKEITVFNSSNSLPETSVENVNYLSSLSQTATSSDKTAGLKVSLPIADEFKWNQVINLNETGLNVPVLSFLPYQYSGAYINPETGEVDRQARFIYVRLTDAYDSNIYVDIELEYYMNYYSSNYAANSMPGFQAGANNQGIFSLSDNLGSFSKWGVIKTFYDEDLTNGAGSKDYYVSWPSAPGNPNNGTILNEGAMIQLYFDTATNQVRVSEKTASETFDKVLVNDLDTATSYGKNIFKGFTTGEVYLSVFAKSYIGSCVSVDMEIESIGTVSGKALHTDVSTDTTAPVIKFDISDKQIENGIYIPLNQAVTVATPTYYDVNLVSHTETVVYNGFKNVSMSGLTFIPTEVGEYTVTYTATDAFKNKTVKTIKYIASDCSDNNNKIIRADLNEDTITSKQIKAGSTVILPEYSIASYNKYVNVSIFAYYGKDIDDKIEIDVDSRELYVDRVGTYTVVFDYSDAVEASQARYTINVVASDNVEWQKIVLPKYFIKDAKYTLDSVLVKELDKTSIQYDEVSYQVSLDGGAFTTVAYDDFTVTASDTVQFKYTYNGDSKLSEIIPVKDVDFSTNSINLAGYFNGNQAIEDYGTRQFALVSNNNGDMKTEFINPISLSEFFVKFIVPEGMANFTSLRFSLTDYANHDNVVYVEYAPEGTGYSFRISTGGSTTTKSLITAKTLSVSYDSSSAAFNNTNLSSLAWDNYFESYKVYLGVELIGVTGKAGVVITSLNGNNITKTTRGISQPAIGYDSSVSGSNTINSVVTVKVAEGISVFCPGYYKDNKIVVSVLDGDNKAITDNNGKELKEVSAREEYQITLSKLGKYIVRYEYTDQKNQSQSYYYRIYVNDEVKPTITIDGGYNEFTLIEKNLGDIVTAKGYKVSDNLDAAADLKVSVAVIDPFYSYIDLIENGYENEDMTFECNYRGLYTVYYYVQDSAGNYATACYKIFVK